MRFLAVFTIVAFLADLYDTKYVSVLERHVRQTADNPVLCQDQDVCASTPDICTSGDLDIVNSLCPVRCGGCVCEDSASAAGTCSSLIPAVCTEDLGATLCPKSCGFCKGPAVTSPTQSVTVPSTCVDQVVGITCADLPYPCNDELGKVACKKFCNLCSDDPVTSTTSRTTVASSIGVGPTTSRPQSTGGLCANNPCLNGGICQESGADSYTCQCPPSHEGVVCHIAVVPTTAPVTTQPPVAVTLNTGSCPTVQTTKASLGCNPAEIVFMIEYSVSDASWFSVDHEGDFIKAMVDKWTLDDTHIRIGVIVYHDTVRESIHLGDYSSKRNLQDKISSITRNLRPSGDADLGKAIDFARENAFKGSRPGVEKFLVPIIHQTPSPEKDRIVPAANRIKNECVVLYGIAVQGVSLDTDVVKAAVTAPITDYYQFYSSYYQLENAGKYYFTPACN
ncbi:hypothetical protein EGW08_015296 [Elysia chlorotica]|uniref:VWFA domain-containing protein n=1 Tax=Elysia chlorotica TaxID=188477 RepID=A0A433T5W8_ELYCH|nr:hypothetical protein EGW08_015296 [Elysia chlorotica]